MIKINLLPTKKKAAKKITEFQKQLIFGGLILAVVLIGMSFYYTMLVNKVDALSRSKSLAEVTVKEQEKKLTEVKTVEEERRKVNEKIAIIEQLKKNQSSLVHLLDEISKALPNGVNLTSLSERSGKVDLEGTAFTNNDLVKFVDNLKACPYFKDVFLVESVQAVQDSVDIYKYKLQLEFRGV